MGRIHGNPVYRPYNVGRRALRSLGLSRGTLFIRRRALAGARLGALP